MKLDKGREQVFFSTVRITIPSKSGRGASMGTGFILKTPLNNDMNRYVTLLISNRHVYGDPTQPIILNFHKRKADSFCPELGQIISLRNREFKGIYKDHPDPGVDLACIDISTIHLYNIFYKAFELEMLSDFSEEDFLPGLVVNFVGYPENRFDIVHNLPLLRTGYIASIPTVDFSRKKHFVIDAQVFPGSSGSPVIAKLGKSAKLVGVIAGTMTRRGQLQAGLPRQILGLGIVIKAPLVKKLVEHVKEEIKLQLKKERREPIEEK